MGELAKRTIKNVFHNAIGNSADRVGAIIFTIIIARLLKPELFGIYAIVIAVCGILLTFANSGIDGTLVRFVSDSLGKNKKPEAAGVFNYLLKLKLILAITSSISLYFLANFISLFVFNKPELIIPLQASAMFVFVFSLFGFMANTFFALQKVKYYSASQILYEVARIFFATVLVLLGYSVFGVIIGLVISSVIILVFSLTLLYKKQKFLFEKKSKIDKTRILSYLKFLFISSMTAIIFVNIDMLMIGAMLPAEQAGYYRAAAALVLGVAAIIATARVFNPLFTQASKEKLSLIFNKAIRYSAIISTPVAFGLAIVAKPFIVTVYGAEYFAAVAVTSVLSFKIIFSATGSFYPVVFNARNMPKYPAYALIISTIINVILNYVFILNYGIIGAAYATLIATTINIGILASILNSKLQIKTNLSYLYKPLISAIIMSLVLLFVLPKPTTIISGLACVLVSATIYFLLMWQIKGITKEDFSLIKTLV